MPTVNRCSKCEKEIKKNNTKERYFIITRPWYYLDGKYMRLERCLLCFDCGSERLKDVII